MIQVTTATLGAPSMPKHDQIDHEKLNEEVPSDDEMLPLLLWDFLNEDDKNWVW